MWETARMAGFITAHAVWSVSSGEVLAPMYGYQKPEGDGGLDRFPGDLQEGVDAARGSLRDNPHDAERAVAVVDAYIDLPDGKTDALIVEAVHYTAERFALTMAIPYRSHASEEGFAVFRPKFISVDGADEDQLDEVAAEFFRGVDSHEDAAPVWAEYLDESR